MADLRTIYLQDQATILNSTTQIVGGVTTYTLTLDGGARETVRVRANGVDVDFLVLDAQTLVITPHGGLQGVAVGGIEFEIHTQAFTGTKSVRLSFELGRYSRRVSGLQKLVQEFLVDLLSSPGSDPFDPSRGGGLLARLGMLSNRRATVGDSLAAVMQSVRATEARLRSKQASTSIPADERIGSVEVQDGEYSAGSNQFQSSIRIRNAAGQSTTVPVTM